MKVTPELNYKISKEIEAKYKAQKEELTKAKEEEMKKLKTELLEELKKIDSLFPLTSQYFNLKDFTFSSIRYGANITNNTVQLINEKLKTLDNSIQQEKDDLIIAISYSKNLKDIEELFKSFGLNFFEVK